MSQSQVEPRPRPTTAETVPTPPDVRASTTVVTTLARADDVEPTDLEVTLYDVIDPDALDALFATQSEADVEVEFEVGEYLVTVRGPDHVLVRPA